MRRAIELTNLLTYSSIYGLGLTDADIIHLQAVHSLFDGKVTAQYIYKSASKGFDLVVNLNAHGTMEAAVSLEKTNPTAVQQGYPLLSFENQVYFKTLPKVSDLEHVQQTFRLLPGVNQRQQLVFNNIDEFKKALQASNLSGLRTMYRFNESVIESCFWAVDRLHEYNAKEHNLEWLAKDMKEVPPYIQKIVSVLQLPNDTRIAFGAKVTVYNTWGRPSRSVDMDYYFTVPGDDCYNFTDKGLYFSHIADETHRPRVIYADPNATFPKDKDVIDAYRRGKPFITLDAATIDMLTKRWWRKQQDLANEKDAIQKLEKKIKEKIEALDKGDVFSYNDIAFTSDSFTYEEQELRDQYVKMSDILRRFSGRYSEEHMNFEQILETWVESVFAAAIKNKTTTGKIGDVDYTIEVTSVNSTSKATGATTVSRTFKVNGSRINKEEIQQVLSRAICFPNTEEFTAFCKSVSACSLKYHRLLASGINIRVHDEIFDEGVSFKIPLEREKGRNFISIGTKRWRVSDTNRLLTVLNADKMSRVITLLMSPDVVGMTGDEIREVLETGKKALIEQRQKEEELLTSTIQQFGIEEMNNVVCANGKTLSGYVVHGNMRDYLVEKSKCMVFEYPSGRYICMVDKGQNEHTNTARLVNRFYALANDSKLAKEISTL